MWPPFEPLGGEGTRHNESAICHVLLCSMMMTNGDGTKLDGVGKRIRIGPPHFVPDRLIDTIEMGAVP